MTKRKAQKHLGYCRETLQFWREAYVDAKRDTNSMMDCYSSFFGKTLREEKIDEALKNIAEAKARISRLERIAR